MNLSQLRRAVWLRRLSDASQRRFTLLKNQRVLAAVDGQSLKGREHHQRSDQRRGEIASPADCDPNQRQAAGRTLRSASPSRISLPRKGCRVGLRIVLFEACSAFTRVTACTLALSPYIVTR